VGSNPIVSTTCHLTRIAHLIETQSPSTASVRFRSLRQFFGWLDDEGERAGANPMEEMRPPMVPERAVPVLTCGRPSGPAMTAWPG
jgi:hypothetical protein